MSKIDNIMYGTDDVEYDVISMKQILKLLDAYLKDKVESETKKKIYSEAKK